MPKHLSVRMAWHDNKWNGRVCKDPESNVYCIGTHSLLSERLAKNKNNDIEKQKHGEKIDKIKEYLPPCFWSANAFSPEPAHVTHVHPFRSLSDKTISEELGRYSAFTWPFRISFNHSKEKHTLEGSYPKDLESRIQAFISQFRPGESVIFFYLNYDNPVSADDHRRVLVGCSLLSNPIVMPPHYDFTKGELESWKEKEDMQNFPTINWALQVSHDFEDWGVVLPYQEYVEYVESHPEEEDKLREIRALIEEDALVARFKYVAESLDDDKCIYLLYKLRKSLSIIKEHPIFNVDREQEIIERLLSKAWSGRGMYPSLGNIIELMVDHEAAPTGVGEEIVDALKEKLKEGQDLLDVTFSILSKQSPIPGYLATFTDTIHEAEIGFKAHKSLESVLRKLSLFSLTKFQLSRIVFPGSTYDAFQGRKISVAQIVANPYILCEEYAATEQERDTVEIEDGPIDVFDIDIGMFPDKRYQARNPQLQDLSPASPERLRALTVKHLLSTKRDGHCFQSLDSVFESIIHYPIFYKESVGINKEELITGGHRDYFSGRLYLSDSAGQTYFYLSEVKYAEELVRGVVGELIKKERTHNPDLTWVDTFLKAEAKELAKTIPNFDEAGFQRERKILIEGVLTNSLYVISGKPGSGKTKALCECIKRMKESGENVVMLAPTGKAVLRAKKATEFQEAETIERFIYSNGFSRFLDDLRLLPGLEKTTAKPKIDNLIVDECSMVDLDELATLFAMLSLSGSKSVKRVILVGDENQLPPIGCGRPFYDLIEFFRSNKETSEKSIRLQTNCRQQFDDKILRVADIFIGRNKYYEEPIEELKRGGPIRKGLEVILWDDEDTLFKSVDKKIREVLTGAGCLKKGISKEASLNVYLGLYESGFVPNKSADSLKLERLQIIGPYKAGFYGTLGLNQMVRGEYKADSWPDTVPPQRLFAHSEKVIRMENWYRWDFILRTKNLVLSNGSIGVVCNHRGRRGWYFPEVTNPIWQISGEEEEKFEPAYAITVHKAQGSEFEHTFIIVPKRRSLLSRELIYTAMTRSTHTVTLFLQRSEPISPIEIAHGRTSILLRNTSLFCEPWEASRQIEPEPGVKVKSKIEYILYRSLMDYRDKSQIQFSYEEELNLKDWVCPIKPDFTVRVGSKTYFWEHLGMLDTREYYLDWAKRRKGYEATGLGDSLITTDDLLGVQQDKIASVIEDMITGSVAVPADLRFSNHHYRLYPD